MYLKNILRHVIEKKLLPLNLQVRMYLILLTKKENFYDREIENLFWKAYSIRVNSDRPSHG